jgi:small-conductance mechanosensitive channel
LGLLENGVTILFGLGIKSYGNDMAQQINAKLNKLEQDKLKLEAEIKSLKKQQIQELSSLFSLVCEDHQVDPMVLLGSCLETANDSKNLTSKKEEWLKAATSFRKKNKSRLSVLLAEKK